MSDFSAIATSEISFVSFTKKAESFIVSDSINTTLAINDSLNRIVPEVFVFNLLVFDSNTSTISESTHTSNASEVLEPLFKEESGITFFDNFGSNNSCSIIEMGVSVGDNCADINNKTVSVCGDYLGLNSQYLFIEPKDGTIGFSIGDSYSAEVMENLSLDVYDGEYFGLIRCKYTGGGDAFFYPKLYQSNWVSASYEIDENYLWIDPSCISCGERGTKLIISNSINANVISSGLIKINSSFGEVNLLHPSVVYENGSVNFYCSIINSDGFSARSFKYTICSSFESYDVVIYDFSDASLSNVVQEIGKFTIANSAFDGVIIKEFDIGSVVVFDSVDVNSFSDRFSLVNIEIKMSLTGDFTGVAYKTPQEWNGVAGRYFIFKITMSKKEIILTGYKANLYAYDRYDAGGDIGSHAGFAAMTDWNGPAEITSIDSSGTSMVSGYSDSFSQKFEGYIYCPTDGTYSFGTNSDDASDVSIDDTVVATYYGSHGEGGIQSGTISLTAGYHKILYYHHEGGGGQGWHCYWMKPSETSWSIITSPYVFHKVGANFVNNVEPEFYSLRMRVLDDSGVSGVKMAKPISWKYNNKSKFMSCSQISNVGYYDGSVSLSEGQTSGYISDVIDAGRTVSWSNVIRKSAAAPVVLETVTISTAMNGITTPFLKDYLYGPNSAITLTYTSNGCSTPWGESGYEGWIPTDGWDYTKPMILNYYGYWYWYTPDQQWIVEGTWSFINGVDGKGGLIITDSYGWYGFSPTSFLPTATESADAPVPEMKFRAADTLSELENSSWILLDSNDYFASALNGRYFQWYAGFTAVDQELGGFSVWLNSNKYFYDDEDTSANVIIDAGSDLVWKGIVYSATSGVSIYYRYVMSSNGSGDLENHDWIQLIDSSVDFTARYIEWKAIKVDEEDYLRSLVFIHGTNDIEKVEIFGSQDIPSGLFYLKVIASDECHSLNNSPEFKTSSFSLSSPEVVGLFPSIVWQIDDDNPYRFSYLIQMQKESEYDSEVDKNIVADFSAATISGMTLDSGVVSLSSESGSMIVNFDAGEMVLWKYFKIAKIIDTLKYNVFKKYVSYSSDNSEWTDWTELKDCVSTVSRYARVKIEVSRIYEFSTVSISSIRGEYMKMGGISLVSHNRDSVCIYDTSSALLTSVKYIYRIRCFDGLSYGRWSMAKEFITTSSEIGVPINLKIDDSASIKFFSSIPVFSWDKVDDSNTEGQDSQTHARVQILDSENDLIWDSGKVETSSGINLNDSGIGATSGVLLQRGVTYYWRIKEWLAQSGKISTGFSALATMKKNSLPSAPVLKGYIE